MYHNWLKCTRIIISHCRLTIHRVHFIYTTLVTIRQQHSSNNTKYKLVTNYMYHSEKQQEGRSEHIKVLNTSPYHPPHFKPRICPCSVQKYFVRNVVTAAPPQYLCAIRLCMAPQDPDALCIAIRLGSLLVDFSLFSKCGFHCAKFSTRVVFRYCVVRLHH